MKLVLVAAVSLAVLASPAFAKGPSEVSIEGPGLAEPITIGLGEEGLAPGSPLMEFTEEVGFHEVVFGETTLTRPEGTLGPRYLVTYRVPGPYGEEFVLHQDLYPYAEHGVVSYLAPRQSIYERKTIGGWFLAPSGVKENLVALGLPADAPTGTDGSPFPWTVVVVVLGVVGAALVLGRSLARRRVPSFDA